MKIISLIILSSSFVLCQEFGIDFNVGYENWEMDKVNDYLDNSEFVEYGGNYFIRDENKKIGGGVCFELGASARISQLVLRLSGTFQSSDGVWESRDTLRYIDHNIDISTLEILVSLGYNFPIYKTASVLLEGGIGYGFAASEINYSTHSYPIYNELENIRYNLSGGYLAARLKGGFEAELKWLLLRFVFGYNYSNLVVLKGESIINGEQKENQPVIDNNGKELEFDFSGISYVWGITILL